MQSESNNMNAIFSNKLNIDEPSSNEISTRALRALNNYYKNNYILIQYVNENITYDGHNVDGPEIECGTLQVIIHTGYNLNRQTNICVPVFQYDIFNYSYIMGKETIPEYCINKKDSVSRDSVNATLF